MRLNIPIIDKIVKKLALLHSLSTLKIIADNQLKKSAMVKNLIETPRFKKV